MPTDSKDRAELQPSIRDFTATGTITAFGARGLVNDSETSC